MIRTRRKVVTLGGGHGQSTALAAVAGLDVELTAIPCVTDEGGCSGKLRQEANLPPPGDARRCLGTLARDRGRARQFEERTARASQGGRSIGNLLIADFAQGNLQQGCDMAAEWLSSRGRVAPAALSAMTLRAIDVHGRVLDGELAIERSSARIAQLDVNGDARANPEAIAAILGADVVVLGPGSFFTSVLAAIAAPGIATALVRTRARLVLFANLTSEGPQTEGMALPCYARTLREHVQRWTGLELGELTIVAHGERESWSALDSKTRLRRAPLAEGNAHSVTAILRAIRDVAGPLVNASVAPPRPSWTRVRRPLRSTQRALARKKRV